MKAQTVKTKINQMIKGLGSRQVVADKLRISLRYVYFLEHGRKPGWRLYRDICALYDNQIVQAIKDLVK